jgi:uncharacterized membrane protein YqjE
MADDLSETRADREPGFFDSLKAVMSDFAALLQTRLELASTEFEEEMERLKQMLLLGAVALFCFSIGVILLTIFVVVVFWDTHRLLALGGLAALYLTAALVVGLIIRSKAGALPKFLSLTISEFAKDRERLRSSQ